MLFIYRFLTFFLFPVFVAITYLRRFTNKEDKLRFKEKISISESYFPKNKKVYWIHAASIGEFKSIIPIIEELNTSNKVHQLNHPFFVPRNTYLGFANFTSCPPLLVS